MKNAILASTSALFGGNYLEYLTEEIRNLFKGVDEIVFIPYARASGLTHEAYTDKVRAYFESLNIHVKGLHEFSDPIAALHKANGIFTGGGNTFLLVKMLHDLDLMPVLKKAIEAGTPYLGTSAGSNIAGINMQTTNDMPIVVPSSFETMGLMPYNLNPHYLDPSPELKHNGETRETRLLEFLSQNDIPVIGLREGNWVRLNGNRITLEGPHTSRIFEKGKDPYEVNSGTALA